MSPKVGEVEGIDIKIKEAEHGNPDIHAWYQGYKVKIFIKTLHVESGGLPPQQMKKLREWMSKNKKYLLKKWNAIVILDY